MKRILIVLVIIASFFNFQSALTKYDEFIFDRFIDYNVGEENFNFAISGELDTSDINEFQQNFEQLLDKYKINSYQRLYVDNEQILWTHTNDKSYLNNIVLTEGKISAINKGDYYFSNDGDKKGTIFNPIRDENYKMYHLGDSSNKHKSIFNPYELVTNEEDRDLVFNNFVDEFQNLYPSLSVDAFSSESHMEPITVDYEDIILAVLMSLMVVLGLSIIIIKQTKKIQILKLEGSSNWQIYRSQVLKYLGLILLVELVTNTAMYFYYIDTSFENAKPFLIYLIVPALIFIASLFIFSIISYITISLININSALKGKSSLKNQINFNYMIKVALIVFTTFIVLNGINYLERYIHIVTTEQGYLNNIKNLYNTTSVKPQHLGNLNEMVEDEEDIEKEFQVKKYLIQENSYFEISYLDELPIENGKGNILVRSVSIEYIHLNLSREVAENIKGDNYVLIPQKLANEEDKILESLNSVMYGGFIEIGGVLTYSDTELINIVPYDYLHYGVNTPDIIIFVSEASSNIGSSIAYFKYDGNSTEAQEYFDNVYLEHNEVSPFYVESVKEQYNSQRAFFLQEFKTILPIFIVIILAIFINTYQQSMLNFEINEKKYAILKSEGSSTVALILGELKIVVLFLLVAQAILYTLMDFPFGDAAFIITFYLVIDVLVLWITTHLKTKHFSESLR